MSVFLWCLGSEVCGVGASRAEAEKDAIDRIFEQTVRPIEIAAKTLTAPIEGLVPSLEAFRMRGVVVEYGLVGALSVELGALDFDALLIKQLRGQVERGVAVFQNAPPPMRSIPNGGPLAAGVTPAAPVARPPVVAQVVGQQPVSVQVVQPVVAPAPVANGTGGDAPIEHGAVVGR